MKNKLLEILKFEGKNIIQEFELASTQGEGTPQDIAEYREGAVQKFISRYYPCSHIVSKGKVTDFEGNQSNSIDCLILNPSHPNLIDSQGKFRLIFADGCDAAIEVKPNLAREDELHRALNQCISLKKILRTRSSIIVPTKRVKNLIPHSMYIPFVLFCIKSFPVEELYRRILAFYVKNNTTIEHQIDGICILDKGFILNIKHIELNLYQAPFPDGENTGWYFEKWGDATVLGLLLYLEHSFSSTPNITKSIMSRALDKMSITDIERLGDVFIPKND